MTGTRVGEDALVRKSLPVLEPKHTGFSEMAARALETDLERRIRGEVRFDAGSRALYATDGSNYRQVPIGVVLPRDLDDVVNTMAVCRAHDAPVLPRGGGTSLAGQCCNVAVVLDFSKYLNRVLEVDAGRRLVRVEPGIVLDDLRRPLEREQGLTFGPDPATHSRCTLGGMIGNDACGVHSVQSEFYGLGPRTSDNVHELDVLTYDGLRLSVGETSEADLQHIIADGGRRATIYGQLVALRDRYADLIRRRFPQIPRRVSGFALDALLPENGFHVARALAGSEGTCVTILSASLHLLAHARAKALVVFGFRDIYTAAESVPRIREHRPTGHEAVDDVFVNDLRRKRTRPQQLALLPPGNAWLLVEFGGDTRQEAEQAARELMAVLSAQPHPPSMKLYDDAWEAHQIWIVRESGLGATAFVEGEEDTWEGWEDAAVPPGKLGPYLREFRELMDRYNYRGALYGHFGQGCVHTRINFDLVTVAGIRKYRAFVEAAAELVVRYGGSLSGEHGDGQSRGELLSIMYGPELVDAFREFKRIWDPTNRMNPGKVVDAYRLDENLRLGSAYRPATPDTHFQFPHDHGSFARATLRCVGVGECRKRDSGTMCPSYMATREEMHSTRGRAHLLFEMLRGEVIEEGWRDRHVHEALDLCLACKACRHECPVEVDMATYKAEFYAHYYQRRLRPRAAYAMGLIHRWARWAAYAPRLANTITQTKGLRGLAKAAAGIAPQRQLPPFAAVTFRRWWRHERRNDLSAATVVLWPDTFTDHFYPEVLQAAVRVLEASGYTVAIPEATLCCGRPLYDFGFLATAKRLLRQVLQELRPLLIRGIPIVGLEPSCVTVFREELPNLYSADEDAHRLANQVYLLAEFLDRFAPTLELPAVQRKAIVQGHCHQKAIVGMTADERILKRLGLDFEILDAGCCGMAGSFGFERHKYELSLQIGERVLLPAVRAAAPDTLLIADGFSCREQIAQATGRRAQHLAETLAAALEPLEGARA